MEHDHRKHENRGHGRPYLMFWVNMILGLVVMYVVMFTMIDGTGDFRNNLNMFYMAVTMWAPMGTVSPLGIMAKAKRFLVRGSGPRSSQWPSDRGFDVCIRPLRISGSCRQRLVTRSASSRPIGLRMKRSVSSGPMTNFVIGVRPWRGHRP